MQNIIGYFYQITCIIIILLSYVSREGHGQYYI